MVEAVRASRAAGPTRILLDLAQQWLGDDELRTVELWLRASGPVQAPEHLVALGVRARREVAVPLR
jgi:hypothetical protein